MSKSYRFKCRNIKCGSEFHRYYKKEEFDKNQYSSSGQGWACFNCGAPQMAVIKSGQNVKDGFQAGYQRNIGKHCETYSEYKAHLKRMGLVELGHEELKTNEEDQSINYWDSEMVKKVMKEHQLDLSGREIAGLENGEIDLMS